MGQWAWIPSVLFTLLGANQLPSFPDQQNASNHRGRGLQRPQRADEGLLAVAERQQGVDHLVQEHGADLGTWEELGGRERLVSSQ